MYSKTVSICDRLCTISSTQNNLEWATKNRFWLFISLKNRLFSNELIEWFIHVCIEYQGHGYICVVDLPYLENIKADLNSQSVPSEEINKINEIAIQRNSQVQRILRKFENPLIFHINWQVILKEVPAWLTDEMHSAFHKKGMFFQELINQVSVMIDPINGDKTRYANFLLAELPLLTYIYYRDKTSIVDFYPGDNINIFNILEQGLLLDELPLTTHFVKNSSPLIYINTT